MESVKNYLLNSKGIRIGLSEEATRKPGFMKSELNSRVAKTKNLLPNIKTWEKRPTKPGPNPMKVFKEIRTMTE